VLTPLVQVQVDARAERDGIDREAAMKSLLGEKQPSMEETANFALSPANKHIDARSSNR
jgi:hypothetical protein